MRKTNWITKQERIDEIVTRADSCACAMIDTEGNPYVVLMNFGYKDGVFYFHGDPNGKKMEALKKNPLVSIMLSVDHKLVHQHEAVACSYGMFYRSVSARGTVEFIEEYEQKIDALNIIMKQYSDLKFAYNSPAVKNVAVWKVVAKELKCKEFGMY